MASTGYWRFPAQATVAEFIQVRHEEMAAFMACAHAKFTGEVGRLHGDLRARRDSPAERALRRQTRPSAGGGDRRSAGARALGGNYQQEVDLRQLFKDVADEYVQMATEPAQMRHLIDRACRIALAERTVTA